MEYIMYNPQDYRNPIPAEEIFGKETARLYKACKALMRLHLNLYGGCYTPEARREWDRLWRVICGIAKRHGVYLDWHGKGKYVCCPDQWEVYKHGERYARIML